MVVGIEYVHDPAATGLDATFVQLTYIQSRREVSGPPTG